VRMHHAVLIWDPPKDTSPKDQMPIAGYGVVGSKERGSGRMSANRNVWSAALPQAKSDVTGWSAQMYTAFVGVNHSWPGWNVLRSFPD